MTWTWTPVTTGVGWIVALVVGLIAIILWFQGTLPKEWALVTLAICVVRL